MYDKACRFVYHHQFIVFIYYVERNIFRFYRSVVMRPVEHEGDYVARTHLVVALHGFVVDVYKARLSGFLYSVTA